MFSVEVNTSDLNSSLRRLTRNANDRNMRRALRAGALPILQRAKQLAPVKSGDLRDSLEIIDDGDSVAIGSKLPYAAIQEFGGRIFITNKMRAFLHAVLDIHPRASTQYVNIPAQPYIRPAFEERRNAGLTRIAASLLKNLFKR